MKSYTTEQTGGGVEAVDVYIRSRCVSCRLLLWRLLRAGVTTRVHDIDHDDVSRAVVRARNRGAETVPTVIVERDVFTRPPSRWLIRLITARYPNLVSTRPARTVWRWWRRRVPPP